MEDHSPLSAADRIDRALNRIETALARREPADQALAERHAALKQRTAEAIATLDDILHRASEA